MPHRLLTLTLIALLSLGSAGVQAGSRAAAVQLAQNDSRPPEVRPRISSARAAAIVQQRYGGKVMNVSARQSGGTVIYRVKILQSSGHMRTVSVNGETGAILN